MTREQELRAAIGGPQPHRRQIKPTPALIPVTMLTHCIECYATPVHVDHACAVDVECKHGHGRMTSRIVAIDAHGVLRQTECGACMQRRAA